MLGGVASKLVKCLVIFMIPCPQARETQNKELKRHRVNISCTNTEHQLCLDKICMIKYMYLFSPFKYSNEEQYLILIT